jgi:hypothetical protein
VSERAKTYRARGYHGMRVRRCVVCHKIAFATEGKAVKGVGAALRSGYLLLRPYLGACGWWHLSSQMTPPQGGESEGVP